MKKNIQYTLYIVLVLGLFLTSCSKDFLDRKPLGRYTLESYPAGGLTQYTYGMYSDLRGWTVHVWGFIGISSITSDDADKGSNPADAKKDIGVFDDFTVGPDNVLVKDFYTGHFAAINKCNIVLQQAEIYKSKISENDYMLAQAEAKFVRGYLYFNLVRTFGGVPLVDSVLTSASTYNIPRASASDIYALIESDLKFAAQNLPQAWDTRYIGRPTSGSAEGMLAKVYMYQQKWSLALGMCTSVISSGIYSLKTPYSEIFSEKGENCSESLFEIQCVFNKTYNNDATNVAVYGCQYANVQGVRGSGEEDLGWGFNSPSDSLVAAFETGDPRKDIAILDISNPPSRYGETFTTVPANVVTRFNGKAYTDPTIRKELKGIDKYRFGYWWNIRILRYADILLLDAEAANELGQTDEALEKLEMVRSRARNGNNTILPMITERDQAKLRNLIRHERHVELAMEHERYWDLVRWGIAGDVLGYKGFTVGKNELMPIPQDELDKSDGLLVQNPGY